MCPCWRRNYYKCFVGAWYYNECLTKEEMQDYMRKYVGEIGYNGPIKGYEITDINPYEGKT